MAGRGLRGLIAGIVAGTCLTASAHEFECTKTVAVLPLVAQQPDDAAPPIDAAGTLDMGLVAGLPYSGSVNVTKYPAVVFWRVDLANVATDAASVVRGLEESVELPPEVPHAPWGVWPVPGLAVPPGVTLTFGMAARIQGYEECLAIAGGGGDPVDESLDRFENVFGVVYDAGFASCRARVVCMPPQEEPPPVIAADTGEVTP